MTKYETFMTLMEKKGKIKAMRLAKQLVPDMPGESPELQKLVDRGCVASSMTTTLKIDPEIKAAYDAAANELMLDKLFEDLDLKKDPDFKANPMEELAQQIGQAIFGDILKGFHL